MRVEFKITESLNRELIKVYKKTFSGTYCVNLIIEMYGTTNCEGGTSFSPVFGSLGR